MEEDPLSKTGMPSLIARISRSSSPRDEVTSYMFTRGLGSVNFLENVVTVTRVDGDLDHVERTVAIRHESLAVLL